jgi:hypothetical protein
MQKWGALMQGLHARTFGAALSPEEIIRVFEQRIAEVKERVSPERLLVFDVRQGWAPLCEFLNQMVPETPFPHENDREALNRAADAFLAGREP